MCPYGDEVYGGMQTQHRAAKARNIAARTGTKAPLQHWGLPTPGAQGAGRHLSGTREVWGRVPAPGEGQAGQLEQELVEKQAGAESAERGEPAEPGGEAGQGRGARGSSPVVGGQRSARGRRGR